MKLIYIFLLSFILISCDKQEIECTPFAPKPLGEYAYNFYPEDQYDFPVRPGSPEWAEFTTGQQMIDACQVPGAILDEMSTNGLIETCLDYPLLINMLAFTSIQYGTERQMENFNGFGELVQKHDAATLMLARYKFMDATVIPDGDDDITIGSSALMFDRFGMVLSQPVFMAQLTTVEKKELVQEAMAKYETFLLNHEAFGIFTAKIQALIMARAMQVEGYKPFLNEITKNEHISAFVADANLQGNYETLNIVIDYSKQFTCYGQ